MKSRTYRLPLFLFLIVLVVFAVFVITRSARISRSEQRVYDALAKEILEKHIERKQGVEKEVAKQVRKEVKKTIFLSEVNNVRREMELRGDVAELEIFQKKSDARLLESFTNATGFIQEELFYTLPDGSEVVRAADGKLLVRNDPARVFREADLTPKQRVRYFEADVAIYDYHTETLIAYNVRFKTYLLNGHELVKNLANVQPETKGTARSMTMHHSARYGVQFSAENLNMEMTE